MLYSVYNYGTRSYDYYMGGQPSTSAHAPSPKRGGRSAMGSTPEQAAWKLPAGARKVGSGYEARGLIATSGIVGDTTGAFELVGAAIAAFILYKVIA